MRYSDVQSTQFEVGCYVPWRGISYPLLRHVLKLCQPGAAVEFGVGPGCSLRLIAENMNMLPVVGFDSFKGLPAYWRAGYPKGAMACNPPEVAGTEIVMGLFEVTLPEYDFAALEPIRLVHMDADLYASTVVALNYVGPHLKPGCFIVFDEFFGYEGCEEHEQRAWFEYVEKTGVSYDVVGHGEQQWAICLK